MEVNLGNSLILIGFLVVVIGIVLNVLNKFGFPHLPGDVLIQKENFTFYFPIVSMIILSVISTIIVNLFRK